MPGMLKAAEQGADVDKKVWGHRREGAQGHGVARQHTRTFLREEGGVYHHMLPERIAKFPSFLQGGISASHIFSDHLFLFLAESSHILLNVIVLSSVFKILLSSLREKLLSVFFYIFLSVMPNMTLITQSWVITTKEEGQHCLSSLNIPGYCVLELGGVTQRRPQYGGDFWAES